MQTDTSYYVYALKGVLGLLMREGKLERSSSNKKHIARVA